MKLLLVFTLVAVATAIKVEFQSVQDRSNPFQKTILSIPTYSSLINSWRQIGQELHSSMSALSVMTPDSSQGVQLQAYSQGCLNAYNDLLVAFQNCSSNLPDTSIRTTDATMQAFCVTSTCPDRINAKFATVLTACTSADDRAIFGDQSYDSFWRRVQMYTNAVCQRIGNEWCWLRMLKSNLITPDPFRGGMNETTLNSLCSECTRRIYSFLLNFGDKDNAKIAAYLDLVCLQINNEYCIKVVADIGKSFDEDHPDFTLLCVPCFRAYMGRMMDVMRAYGSIGQSGSGAGDAAASSTMNMMRAFCTRDNTGQFCAAAFGRAQAALAPSQPSDPDAPGPCPNNVQENSPCPAECVGFVTTFRNHLGCCAKTIMSAMNDAFSSSGNHTRTDMMKWFETRCNVRFPPACSGLAVRAQFVIKNFLYSYYISNRATVEAKMRLDLAQYLGVSAEDITIDSVVSTTVSSSLFQPMAAGMTVQYSATPGDVTQANAMRTQILSGQQIPFGALSSLPLSSRENPGQPLSIDPAGSTADVIVTGSASATGASFWLVAAAAIATLLAGRF